VTTNLHVRIERPFTVGQLRAAALQALAELVPGVRVDVLDVKPRSQEFHGHYRDAPPVADTFFDAFHGAGNPPAPGYLIMTPDGEAVAGVSELDVGYPEDPEGGRRLWVTRSFYREPASRLLGVAVAAAAARLSGSPVVDEYEELTGERLADPEAILHGLRDPTVQGGLDEAAAAVLHAAGID
jgi:hypothetical protein